MRFISVISHSAFSLCAVQFVSSPIFCIQFVLCSAMQSNLFIWFCILFSLCCAVQCIPICSFDSAFCIQFVSSPIFCIQFVLCSAMQSNLFIWFCILFSLCCAVHILFCNSVELVHFAFEFVHLISVLQFMNLVCL
eukprot:153018_1